MSYSPERAPDNPKEIPTFLTRTLQRLARETQDTRSFIWHLVDFATPAQITSNQNDYAPMQMEGANVLRISSDIARDITGIKAPVNIGRVLYLRNIGSTTITLKNASASSAAANRFDIGADFALTTKRSVCLWYDGVSARWCILQ
jgi:hypothetical protein